MLFQMFKLYLEKAEEPEIKLPHFQYILQISFFNVFHLLVSILYILEIQIF